jgi:hypothetical protein
MIPSNVDDFNNSYGEKRVYEALRDSLPSDYTVFHSFCWNKKSTNRIEWGEADFAIFHPQYGILVVEVKSGGIALKDGKWYYERTDNQKRYPMKDPLEQANRTKYAIKQLLDNTLPQSEYVWAESIVWFPSLSEKSAVDNMPNTYHPEIVLMEWALDNVKKAIENAYNFYDTKRRTKLSSEGEKFVIRTLAPAFNAVPSLKSTYTEQEYQFLRLTNEQNGLLDYLDEQPSAAIQGSAGTGKTILAVEKAKRLSKDGKVLFLCFNRFLVDDLRLKNKEYKNSITFCNLLTLVKTKTKMEGMPKEQDITNFLNQYDTYDNWDYQHIIVDEGQDLSNEHLELLATIAKCEEGAFYVFYDKNQLVQKYQMQEYLQKAECRLVLRRNCRNTHNIATTAARPIGIEPVIWEKLPAGKLPDFYILSNVDGLMAKLTELVKKYVSADIPLHQITILTMKTEETSLLSKTDKIGNYKITRERDENSVLFTTARKFKGLESDVIIIIDIDSNTFTNADVKNLFYVGASRAKHFLDITAIVDNDGLINMAKALTGKEAISSISQIAAALKVRINKSEQGAIQ